MAGRSRWYFDKETLANSPSRKCGIDADKELSYRQQAANMIQDMGQRLQVTQLCINTAIVYMHRFYVFHSFSKFHRANIAACALFLAAKVEEQPRKLEHVIKVAHLIQHQKSSQLDLPAEAAKLVKNENVMLQTLGFDIAIEHPHTFVVKCCQLVRASKDLAQTCYFMATNSLHLTTMCLQYKPTVVACVCIHLACKWSSWEIPQSSEGKSWWYYVDADVSVEKLEELTKEFLAILDKCPSRLKRKIMSGGGQGSGCDTLPPHSDLGSNASQPAADVKVESDPQPSSSRTPVANSQSSSASSAVKVEQPAFPVPSVSVPSDSSSRTSPVRFQAPAIKEKQSYSVYKEKKEQERRENERKEAERNELDKKRVEAERQERERRVEAERRVAIELQREQERLDRERKEQEAQRRELEVREAERKEAEKRADLERRAEADRREKERRAELERREVEKREADKRDAERREQERLKAEKAALELREAERQAELERKEAELRQQEELQRLEEERQRREELDRQEATRVHEEQVKRETEKKNRIFTSRTPTTAPTAAEAPAAFEELIAKTRTDDSAVSHDDGQRLYQCDVKVEPHQKHHKSEKSHKRKKSKHKERHKDKNRDKRERHEKQEAETVPPIKLKIKPLQEPEPVPESFKIRIPRDRLLNHSSSSATADSEASRKRKNAFEAGSINKKPVV